MRVAPPASERDPPQRGDSSGQFLSAAGATARSIVRGDGLVGSSGLVFVGNLIARALGLLFLIAAARFLGPTKYGLLAYALVIANLGSVLINNAPAAMAGFLARNAGNRTEQERYFSNWAVVVTGSLAISLVAIVPLALLVGLRDWMIPALWANLLGVAVFESYRRTQQGLANFGRMAGFYVIANAIQLGVILVLGLLEIRDAALYLTVYGLTNVAALILLQSAAPTRLHFSLRAVRRGLVRQISLISLPLVLQTSLYTVWFGADLIMVRFFLAPPFAGNYAAAKTLVNIVAFPAGAIGMALLPRIAGLKGPEFRRQMLRGLALTALPVVPALLLLVSLDGPIVSVLFGAKYPHATDALPWLGWGMGAYAFYIVLESVWVGLGRPVITAVATGCGMVVTIAAGITFIPHAGLAGAGASFAMGAVTHLAVIGAFTVAAYVRSRRTGDPIGRQAILEQVRAMNPEAS